MLKCLKLAAASLLCLALVACGGGGGGGGEPPAIQPAAQAVIRATAQAVNTDTDGSVKTSVGATVSLDASASQPGSGTLSSYTWTVESRPTGSKVPLVDATSARASFAPDLTGAYTLRVRVTDSSGGTAAATVALTVASAPAVPNVTTAVSFSGPSNEVAAVGTVVGAQISLDASASGDPAGGPLTLSWSFIEKPANSSATLAATATRASFTADVAGNYRVKVRGQTSTGNYAEVIHSYVVTDGAPRVLVSGSVSAASGASRTLNAAVGNVILLQGTDLSGFTFGITDPSWTLVSKPAASRLGTPTGSTPYSVSFIPDTAGAFVLQFSARDRSNGVVSTYTMTVAAENGPSAYVIADVTPVASATGPSFVAAPGQPMTLRGGNSVDPAGSVLSYAWRVSASPSGSSATLATPSTVNTLFTPDRIGQYKAELIVTTAAGLSSLQEVTILVGVSLPTALVERASTSVLVGNAATVSAASSSSASGNALSYSWAIDARPLGSVAAIAAPSDAVLRFTPDVAGSYTATVTVSDGPLKAIAPVTIVALSASAGVVPLTYTPGITKFSKALGKAVIATADPLALHLVDPATGADTAITLPAAVKAMAISPSGRYAALLHDNTATSVDLRAGKVLRSFFTNGAKTDIVALDNGVVVLAGTIPSSFSYNNLGYQVIDGLTGTTLQTLANNSYFSSMRVVQADQSSRLFAVGDCCSSNVQVTTIDPTSSLLTHQSTASGAVNGSSNGLWLSDDQAWLFTATSAFYRTSDFASLGTLIPTPSGGNTPRMLSFSHSAAASEAVALELLTSTSCCDFTQRYSPVYKRWTGGLLFAAADVALPKIDGEQSYGLAIFHTSDQRRAVLVQTGSDKQVALGMRYYLLLR